MAVINDYPEVQSLSDDDMFLVDTGATGYKSVKKRSLVNIIENEVIEPATERVVSSIYNTCIKNGRTPTAQTISACNSAINDIRMHAKLIDIITWNASVPDYVISIQPDESYFFVADMYYSGNVMIPTSGWGLRVLNPYIPSADNRMYAVTGDKYRAGYKYIHEMSVRGLESCDITIQFMSRTDYFTDSSCRLLVFKYI